MVYLIDQDVMTAQVTKTCSWILRRILDLREHVQTIKTLWDRMLTQRRFRMSVVYHELIGKDHQVDWKALVCMNAAIPRAVFTTWLICHGWLTTKNRLKRFNMIKDSSCSFCHNAEESIAHFNFDCRHNADVLKWVLDWSNVPHIHKPWNE